MEPSTGYGPPPSGRDSRSPFSAPASCKSSARSRSDIRGSQLVAAAKHRNVALKATGAPSYSTEAYPYRDIHGHIRALYDAFGPERMFWGTDITRMPCSWRQCVTMFTEDLPWLSAKDKDLIMGRAVCTWLGWNLPG